MLIAGGCLTPLFHSRLSEAIVENAVVKTTDAALETKHSSVGAGGSGTMDAEASGGADA